MKIIKKSRQNLAQLTEEILTPLGFSRRGTCFLREAPECIQIVQLQGSRYNTGTYVNQMVWFKHFGSSAPLPIGSDFHFSTRMESASATEEPHWMTVLDASGEPIDRSHWKDQLAILFQSQIPVFDLLQTLSWTGQPFVDIRFPSLMSATEVLMCNKKQYADELMVESAD